MAVMLTVLCLVGAVFALARRACDPNADLKPSTPSTQGRKSKAQGKPPSSNKPPSRKQMAQMAEAAMMGGGGGGVGDTFLTDMLLKDGASSRPARKASGVAGQRRQGKATFQSAMKPSMRSGSQNAGRLTP